MRKLLSVLLGTAVGLGVIAGLAWLNLHLFPWPDFDWHNPQAWGDVIAVAQPTPLALIAGAWPVATLIGGLVAVRAANWAVAGWMATVLLAIAGAVSVLLVPQPLWMQVVAIVSPFIAGVIVSGAS